jgi:multidrug transporter EmrE-like cation transporter
MDNLTTGEKVAAVSGVLLFIFMFFFDWFGGAFGGDEVFEAVTGEDLDTGFNAWNGLEWIRFILLFAVIASVGLAVLKLTDLELDMGVPASAIVAGLGILSTLLVLYRVLDPPFSSDREIGLFLGLASCVGIAIGGWLAMQEEGASFGDIGSGGGGAAPPPAGGGGAAPPAPPPEQAPPPPPPAQQPPPQ